MRIPQKRENEGPIWSAPKLWPGSTVFILGGGPSLKSIEFDGIKNKRCIGVNNAYTLGNWIDICWFGDNGWWRKNGEEALKSFSSQIVHCSGVHHDRIKRLKRDTKSYGLTTDRSRVVWNKCSGSSAINLAYHLGAKRVILLGFDMRKVEIDGELRNNWHKDHLNKKSDPYARFLTAFPFIKRDADKLGLEIINATPSSAIKVFPIMTLEEILDSNQDDGTSNDKSFQ